MLYSYTFTLFTAHYYAILQARTSLSILLHPLYGRSDSEEKPIVECGSDAGAIPLGFSVSDRIRFCILQCLGNFQRGSVGHPDLGRGEHPRGGILPRHASTRAGLPAGPVLFLQHLRRRKWPRSLFATTQGSGFYWCYQGSSEDMGRPWWWFSHFFWMWKRAFLQFWKVAPSLVGGCWCA